MTIQKIRQIVKVMRRILIIATVLAFAAAVISGLSKQWLMVAVGLALIIACRFLWDQVNKIEI